MPPLKRTFLVSSLAISSILLSNNATAALTSNVQVVSHSDNDPNITIHRRVGNVSGTNRANMTYTSRDRVSRYSMGTQRQSWPYQDAMQVLIERQQQKYANSSKLVIEEKQVVNSSRRTPFPTEPFDFTPSRVDIETWLNAAPNRKQQALEYQRYLANRIGKDSVPPLSELFLTARDWYKCGFEPYEIPPRHLWDNNVNTFELYALLKNRGILPPTTQIRSVYRNESLNACADGAPSSQHVVNGAIDIWVPEYEDKEWLIHQLQDNLCTFRLYEGRAYDFGLGLYSSNSYHIDTHRVRIWGAQHTQLNSPCRIPLE